LRVVLAPLAEQQLDSIADYIAERAGEARAEAYVSRIVAYCRSFRTFPHRGTRCDHISPGLRIVGFERRVTIAFRVFADEVVIAQVLYGGQDIEAAFRKE
jgi:toxin ParE1/3/4